MSFHHVFSCIAGISVQFLHRLVIYFVNSAYLLHFLRFTFRKLLIFLCQSGSLSTFLKSCSAVKSSTPHCTIFFLNCISIFYLIAYALQISFHFLMNDDEILTIFMAQVDFMVKVGCNL